MDITTIEILRGSTRLTTRRSSRSCLLALVLVVARWARAH